MKACLILPAVVSSTSVRDVGTAVRKKKKNNHVVFTQIVEAVTWIKALWQIVVFRLLGRVVYQTLYMITSVCLTNHKSKSQPALTS